MRKIKRIEFEIKEILQRNAPMTMTEADEKSFEEATVCHLCGKPFDPSEGEDKCSFEERMEERKKKLEEEAKSA